MKKELIDIIKETADFYDIELVEAKNKMDAEVFLDVDGKKVNILDLSPDTIWDKLFNNSFINYDYIGKMTNDNIGFVKKINYIKLKNQAEGIFSLLLYYKKIIIFHINFYKKVIKNNFLKKIVIYI